MDDEYDGLERQLESAWQEDQAELFRMIILLHSGDIGTRTLDGPKDAE